MLLASEIFSRKNKFLPCYGMNFVKKSHGGKNIFRIPTIFVVTEHAKIDFSVISCNLNEDIDI